MKNQKNDKADNSVLACVNHLKQEADYGKVLDEEAKKVWLAMSAYDRQQFRTSVCQQLVMLNQRRSEKDGLQ